MGVREATTETVKVRPESPPRRVRKGSEPPSTRDSAALRRGRPLPGAGSRWATAALGTGWAGRADTGEKGAAGGPRAPRRREAGRWGRGPGGSWGRGARAGRGRPRAGGSLPPLLWTLTGGRRAGGGPGAARRGLAARVWNRVMGNAARLSRPRLLGGFPPVANVLRGGGGGCLRSRGLAVAGRSWEEAAAAAAAAGAAAAAAAGRRW